MSSRLEHQYEAFTQQQGTTTIRKHPSLRDAGGLKLRGLIHIGIRSCREPCKYTYYPQEQLKAFRGQKILLPVQAKGMV